MRLSHAYTWGAYGESPFGVRYELPKRSPGMGELEIKAGLVGQRDLARTVRFDGRVNVPRQSVDALIQKHRRQLANISLPFEPDNPQVDPNLYKLAVLDQRLQEEGKRSLFRTRHRRLRLTRNNRYTHAIDTPVSGIYPVRLTVRGRSHKGFIYQRQARFDVRI